MSYRYLREGEVASSPHGYWDGHRFVPSSCESSRENPSSGVSGRDTSNDSPSGMTSTRLTAAAGGESMSSAEDSPARTSARQVKVEDLPEPVRDFGSRCSALLTRLGLALSGRKTVRSCVPVDSAPSSRDLPAWGMTHAGACWELGTSARITTGTDCGCWPPEPGDPSCSPASATSSGTVPSAESTMRSAPAQDQRRTASSTRQTGSTRDHWPTASARDWKDTPGMARTSINRDGSKRTDQLARAVYAAEDTPPGGGMLNPDWTEWLMGWPIGWSALSRLATGRFQRWLRQHSGFFPRG